MKQGLIAIVAVFLFGLGVLVPNSTKAESEMPDMFMNAKKAMMMPMSFIEGNGIIKTERRNVPNYTSLIIEGPFEVSVDTKGEPMIRITTDENLISHVLTEAEGNMLKIYAHAGFETNSTLKIEVHNKNLSKIVATDRANVDIDNLNAPRFEVSAADETDINLSGKATEFEAYLSDHARLKASHLQTKNAKIVQMGNSHAEVYASQRLDLDVTDAAKLFYYGKPAIVNKTVTGTAQLNQR